MVSGTPGLEAFETQCAPPRGAPQPRCLPPPPPPHASRLQGNPLPCPCIPAAGICPRSILRCPPSPHPVRTFLSQSLPCRSLVTGVVPSRSLGLTLRPTPKRGGSSPLRRVPVSPSGGARPTPGCTMGAAPGPDRLLSLHPPSPGPAPELAPESPLQPSSAQTSGAKKGIRAEGLRWS